MTKFDRNFKRIDPVDEVIDILDQIGQDEYTADAMSRPRPQSSTSPQVSIQQTDKLPMSPEQQKAQAEKQKAQAFRNLYGGNKSLGLYSAFDDKVYNVLSPSPEDNLSGFQQASAPPRNPVGSVDNVLFDLNIMEALGQPINYGGGEGQLAPANVNPLTLASYGGGEGQLSGSFTNYPGGEGYRQLTTLPAYQAMDPNMFDPDTGDYINFLDRIDQQRALNAGQGIASVAPVNPMAQERAADYMRALQMGQTEDYKDFFFNEASRDPSILDPLQAFVQKAFGYPEGMRGLYEMEQNKKAAMARNKELEEFSRKDREDRERAAMLAAQQQQPVDPCPEGYRMDPVSKVCVPVDDTIDTDPVKRTYETMTKPQENYTAATNFNVPAITLPDILKGLL